MALKPMALKPMVLRPAILPLTAHQIFREILIGREILTFIRRYGSRTSRPGNETTHELIYLHHTAKQVRLHVTSRGYIWVVRIT
eukprot:81513-Amorphochlora_amoeboformis.AAC.1